MAIPLMSDRDKAIGKRGGNPSRRDTACKPKVAFPNRFATEEEFPEETIKYRKGESAHYDEANHT